MTLPLLTPRLAIRLFTDDDAAFVVELLNDPDWLRFIGDRQVRTLDDARAYLRANPRTVLQVSYRVRDLAATRLAASGR